MKVLTGVRPFGTITAGEAEELRRQGIDARVDGDQRVIWLYKEREEAQEYV